MPDWTFYIETFGCKVNQYETQLIREAWTAENGIELKQPENADFILINSCAITANAERDARNAIYRTRKAAPFARIILCGCAAQFLIQNEKIRKIADYILPQKDKRLLLRSPLNFAGIPQNSLKQISTFTRARPVIKIQDGCSRYCAYCIVPQTRNAISSRPLQEVLSECRSLLDNGFAEIVISGVNLLQYGEDLSDKTDFWTFVRNLDEILHREYADTFRIRISSLDPALLNDSSLETLASSRVICPHLHLSLQHASPVILHRMRRAHYTPDQVSRYLEKLRGIWPVFGLGADFLLGFPGETETDMQILEDFISQSAFSYAHIFPFSVRPNTSAFRMKEQVPFQVKKERTERIGHLIEKSRARFLKNQVSLKKFSILPENNPENGKGINEYYCQCRIINYNGHKKGLLAVEPINLENGILNTRILD